MDVVGHAKAVEGSAGLYRYLVWDHKSCKL